MSDITWTNEKRKLSDLIPWPRNPRQIKSDSAKRLVNSKKKFAQPWPIIIGPNGELYDGHQRLNVWGQEWGADLEVDVRVASRQLTEKEREELVILAHKGAAGEFDMEVLANEFEVTELIEWGFKEYELGIVPDAAQDPNDLWQGMPEFEQEDALGDYHTIKVHFQNEDAMKEFASLVGQVVSDDTKFIWYPKLMRMDLKKYRAVDES